VVVRTFDGVRRDRVSGAVTVTAGSDAPPPCVGAGWACASAFRTGRHSAI
jgi:hypothetical protein